jgi:hypothetical protein
MCQPRGGGRALLQVQSYQLLYAYWRRNGFRGPWGGAQAPYRRLIASAVQWVRRMKRVRLTVFA